jgi:hypothetical protein
MDSGRFLRLLLAVAALFTVSLPLRAQLVLTEFMAANSSTLAAVDGGFA